MNLKTGLLALAAVVALGTTSLTSTSAEAAGFHGGGKGFHGGGKGFHGGGFHGGKGFHGGHHGKHWGHGHFHRPHRHVHWHGHWRHRHIYYPRPVVYAARPVVYSAAPVVTTNRCTCLTKEYTPEGAVLFKDICTNEAAINPPPAPPVQTGYAPQPQTTGPIAQ